MYNIKDTEFCDRNGNHDASTILMCKKKGYMMVSAV